MAWSNRVRVTEQTRKSAFQRGVSFSDGWRVELRLSADGEPERWESPERAAILGPDALVDALDGACGSFASREEADSAAARLVAAFEIAVPA
jgi:hypothetical protein